MGWVQPDCITSFQCVKLKMSKIQRCETLRPRDLNLVYTHSMTLGEDMGCVPPDHTSSFLCIRLEVACEYVYLCIHFLPNHCAKYNLLSWIDASYIKGRI